MKDYTEVTVLFNKANTYVGFNTDANVYQKHRNGEIHSFIYKDLSESVFATTFLDLRNFKSRNLDIRLQFNNILPQFREKIQYEANETIKVSKVQTPNGLFESSLYIYVFSFLDYSDEFLFFLAERQHIDVALNKKLVRTSALQISSKDAYEDLIKTIEFHNNKAVKTESVDDSLKTIFQQKQNINFRRL